MIPRNKSHQLNSSHLIWATGAFILTMVICFVGVATARFTQWLYPDWGIFLWASAWYAIMVVVAWVVDRFDLV